MSELRALCDAGRALREARRPALLVTLMSVRGSSYRRPGARLLIASPDGALLPDGGVTGSVSGGCLERDLVRRGWWRLATAGPAVATYDSTDEDELRWRLGLGCGGAVDLLLERLDPARPDAIDPLAFIEGCLDAQRPGVLVTVFRSRARDVPVGTRLSLRATEDPAGARETLGGELAAIAREALASGAPTHARELGGGTVEALVETVEPPPHLFLCGSGRDVVPVASLARGLGWTVSLWTPRPRFELRARFARLVDHLCASDGPGLTARVNAAACPLGVVMSHNVDDDRTALDALLRSRARYVGVLGPRHRTQHLLSGGEAPARLHAPVGLAIGAETPAEIALSIISEAQAVLAGGAAGHLRDQPVLHEAAPATRATEPGR